MGIDIKYVREYYQGLTNEAIIKILTHEAKGLTNEAMSVVREEISRRNLDPQLHALVNAQQQIEEEEMKTFDPDGSPVEEEERLWLEEAFIYLVSLFGKAETQRRKVLVPDRRDFPIRYDGSERCAIETLHVVARQMETDPVHIKLDFYDEDLRVITDGTPGGMYWGKQESGHFEISMALRILHEPEEIVSILAHEVAHIKLLGENRMEDNDEKLTDMTTIFFGLGVFAANSAFKTFNTGWSQSGYLTQMEWGYALALFAQLRNEDEPAWLEHLCTNVRADYSQSRHFMKLNGIDILRHL